MKKIILILVVVSILVAGYIFLVPKKSVDFTYTSDGEWTNVRLTPSFDGLVECYSTDAKGGFVAAVGTRAEKNVETTVGMKSQDHRVIDKVFCVEKGTVDYFNLNK